MSKKDPFYDREKEKYDNPVPSREYILDFLKASKNPASFADLCSHFDVYDDERITAFKRRLRAMERDGQIIFDRSLRYSIPSQSELVTGTVIGHRDGYGFLQIGDGQDDWFIPANQMYSVLHGDKVMAIADGSGFKNKTEARIIRVIEPRDETVVGRLYVEHNMSVVVPEDNRIAQDILVPPGNEGEARHNQVVAVQIVKRPNRRMSAIGQVTEVLGSHMEPGMEINIALNNFDIPHSWPDAVLNQIDGLQPQVADDDKSDRVDLRDLPLVTIDGEDARDFDDAVFCEKKKSGGWRLWVAIADVSHYVRTASPLDKEALNRGNSVYFPEQVVPMLPEVLSNGLCSLNPQVDRLCMVCEMTISDAGRLSGYRFYEAVMNSSARFTYTQVAAILDGDAALREQYDPLVGHLEDLNDMYKALVAQRAQRGAIEFETVETKFVFNENRKIEAIVPTHRNDAHKIIEECMILANVSAAKLIEKHEKSALYRVHDKPDQEKLAHFRDFLGEMGLLATFTLDPEPAELTEQLKRLSDTPESELIQVMLLRSMKQAVYQRDNIGHFGLALPAYAHFTSPIRRYPDLVVHRTIKGILAEQGQLVHGEKLYSEEEADAMGEQCSMTERRADDATRDVADWLKCEFMQNHLGDVHEGVIAAVTSFGFFVRLTDLYIDGLVHVTSLNNDFYHFDSAKGMLIGEATKTQFRLGDPVVVKVVSVNLDQRKIDFELAGESALQGRRRKGRGKGKPGAPKGKFGGAKGKSGKRAEAPSLSIRDKLRKGKVSSDKTEEESDENRSRKKGTLTLKKSDKKNNSSSAKKRNGKSGKDGDTRTEKDTKKQSSKKRKVKKRPGKNARKKRANKS